jgi:hypothetical protein
VLNTLGLVLCLGVRSDAQVWTSIGPTPLFNGRNARDRCSGRVSLIAVVPVIPTTGCSVSENGGVWATHDGGGSSAPLTTGAPALAIGAVAFAPSNPGII